MKIIRYFFEFIIIKFLFLIFKLIGYKRSSDLGEKIGKIFGPLFRSKKIILENLEFSNIEDNEFSRTKIILCLDLFGHVLVLLLAVAQS